MKINPLTARLALALGLSLACGGAALAKEAASAASNGRNSVSNAPAGLARAKPQSVVAPMYAPDDDRSSSGKAKSGKSTAAAASGKAEAARQVDAARQAGGAQEAGRAAPGRSQTSTVGAARGRLDTADGGGSGGAGHFSNTGSHRVPGNQTERSGGASSRQIFDQKQQERGIGGAAGVAGGEAAPANTVTGGAIASGDATGVGGGSRQNNGPVNRVFGNDGKPGGNGNNSNGGGSGWGGGGAANNNNPGGKKPENSGGGSAGKDKPSGGKDKPDSGGGKEKPDNGGGKEKPDGGKPGGEKPDGGKGGGKGMPGQDGTGADGASGGAGKGGGSGGTLSRGRLNGGSGNPSDSGSGSSGSGGTVSGSRLNGGQGNDRQPNRDLGDKQLRNLRDGSTVNPGTR